MKQRQRRKLTGPTPITGWVIRGLAEMEIGTIERFRFIESPCFLSRGTSASVKRAQDDLMAPMPAWMLRMGGLA